MGKRRLRESHEGRRKNFHLVKNMFDDKLVGNKGRMGLLILERCDIQHEGRLLLQSIALTETHKRIILELFTLAISRYADVRSKAQSSIFSAIRYFPYPFTFLVSRITEILAKDTEEHHDAYKVRMVVLD